MIVFRRPPDGLDVVVLRNRVNHLSGWILGVGLLLFVVVLDPLSAYTSGRWQYDDPSNRAGEWHFALFFGALSVIGFRAFAHPRVEVAPTGRLTIVGWLRRVSTPLAAVAAVDTSREYVRLKINGRFYTATGLEGRQLDWFSGGDPVVERLGCARGDSSAEPPAATVDVTVSWPSTAEILLLSAWTAYVVLALAVGFPR